jgi:hypothetical protein
MKELALHLLDIAENSVAAGARTISIAVEEDLAHDRLRLSVCDDGQGMDPALLARAGDPFATTRTTRKVGLGLPLLKAAAEACNGSLQLASALGQGTCLAAEFQHSHLDRMPLGDLAGTWLTLLAAHPDVHWQFHYCSGPAAFLFDDEDLKRELGEVPLTEPAVLRYLREMLAAGVNGVQKTSQSPSPLWSSGAAVCQS